MSSTSVHVIRNVKHFKCGNCEHPHEYVSGQSDRSPCGTPIGFSYDRALEVAQELGIPEEAVVEAPDFELVRLDDSARKLPRGGAANAPGLHREVIQPML